MTERTAIASAMVLAAGLGERMRPLTLERPKPLIKVAGRTLLDHALDRLTAAGVGRAVVNLHHMAPIMRAHLARRVIPEITFSDETGTLLGPDGGIVKALPHLGPGAFLTSNADVLFRTEDDGRAVRGLLAAWDEALMDALLLLVPGERVVGDTGPGDFFRDCDGRLGFRGHAARAPFFYVGLQIVRPSLYADARVQRFPAYHFWMKALAKGRLFGHVEDMPAYHVGSPEGLEAVARALSP